VERFDRPLTALVDELFATTRAVHGLGIAAPQIGEPLRVAVVEIVDASLALVNPALLEAHGTQLGWEGCLSVPDRVARVPRAADVTLSFDDAKGRRRTMRADGLLARALLHEIDHLDGRLYTDIVAEADLVDTRAHPTPP
jgi:peptide deformylase